MRQPGSRWWVLWTSQSHTPAVPPHNLNTTQLAFSSGCSSSRRRQKVAQVPKFLSLKKMDMAERSDSARCTRCREGGDGGREREVRVVKVVAAAATGQVGVRGAARLPTHQSAFSCSCYRRRRRRRCAPQLHPHSSCTLARLQPHTAAPAHLQVAVREVGRQLCGAVGVVLDLTPLQLNAQRNVVVAAEGGAQEEGVTRTGQQRVQGRAGQAGPCGCPPCLHAPPLLHPTPPSFTPTPQPPRSPRDGHQLPHFVRLLARLHHQQGDDVQDGVEQAQGLAAQENTRGRQSKPSEHVRCGAAGG